MPHEPKTNREFSCFDDCPENNGWGYNSEPRPSIPEQENDYEDEIEYPRNEFIENTIVVENKGNFNCSNDVDK